MIRVTLLGPECCGKTTLVHELVERCGAIRTDEYARTYAEEVGRSLGVVDVEPIARGQQMLIRSAMAKQSSLVVHDTDLLSTIVYSRYYYGYAPQWVRDAYLEQRPDLAIVLAPFEWVDDQVRDSGADRREVTQLFLEELRETRTEWLALGHDRLRSATAVVEALLRKQAENH